MKPARVLLVEDNPVTRKVTRVALEGHGYQVEEVSNAKGALEAITRSTPDLVLQDIRLPDMDGVELCRRIRELSRRRTLPILAFTGSLDRLAQYERNETDFNEFLLKPLEPSRLVAIVRKHLTA